MSDKEIKEQESVSEQSDKILEHMQDRFQQLIEQDRMDDAIAIGDEYLEWLKGDDDEVYFYFVDHELKELL